MRNKYLSYDEKRAPKVREMFSRLAKRYDLVNGWRPRRSLREQAVARALRSD